MISFLALSSFRAALLFTVPFDGCATKKRLLVAQIVGLLLSPDEQRDSLCSTTCSQRRLRAVGPSAMATTLHQSRGRILLPELSLTPTTASHQCCGRILLLASPTMTTASHQGRCRNVLEAPTKMTSGSQLLKPLLAPSPRIPPQYELYLRSRKTQFEPISIGSLLNLERTLNPKNSVTPMTMTRGLHFWCHATLIMILTLTMKTKMIISVSLRFRKMPIRFRKPPLESRHTSQTRSRGKARKSEIVLPNLTMSGKKRNSERVLSNLAMFSTGNSSA